MKYFLMNKNTPIALIEYDTNKKFSEMLSNIKDISRIEISALDGLVDEYKSILLKYQRYTDSSLDRIDKLCNGLQIRIDKLKDLMKY